MYDMSQTYRLRKYHLEHNEVPTQTLMKNEMCSVLADIYFKSMSPKLKVLAGLEPPLQGGGSSWYVPPEELLQERIVLKPIKKEFLSNLAFIGVDKFGSQLIGSYREQMKLESDRLMFESSINWKQKLDEISLQHRIECSTSAAAAHTVFIKNQVQAFNSLYAASVTKLEDILLDAAISIFTKSRDEITQKMQIKYEILLRQQATKINKRYIKKLRKMKDRLRQKFKKDVQRTRIEVHENLHDIKIEKRTAVEKLRKYLECLNLANQAYVALVERQQCAKDIEIVKKKHDLKKKMIENEITYRGYQIKYAQEKEKKRIELQDIWQKKVAHILNSFQRLISYCLHLLPEHAEFFINLEKLMLLQLDAALECPSIHSIIMEEKEPFRSPIPIPQPFYLLADKGFKPKINQDLCPKHCATSSSQLPVIVVNKRCIYSACDNFEQLADKLKDYGYDRWGDKIQDNHDYSNDVPVKYTSSKQLLELKLESSLMQLLQQEIANARNIPIECTPCDLAQCFCSSSPSLDLLSEVKLPILTEEVTKQSPLVHYDDIHLSDKSKMIFAREPKIESYSRFVKPQKCDCSKIAKKGLMENLPVYMRSMSQYETPEMLNYEICSPFQLEHLMKTIYAKPLETTDKLMEMKKDAATQTSDDEHDSLCVCFSDDSIRDFMEFLNKQDDHIFKTFASKSEAKPDSDMDDVLRASKAAFRTKHRKSLIKASYFTHPGVSRSEKDVTCVCTH